MCRSRQHCVMVHWQWYEAQCSKSSFYVLHKKSQHEFVYTVMKVESCKYLCVTLTADLTWKCHVNAIYTTAYKRICTVCEGISNKHHQRLSDACQSCVHLPLECTVAVWDSYTKMLQNELERMLSLAVHFISITRLCQNGDLPLLAVRHEHVWLKYLYQIDFHLIKVPKHNYLAEGLLG